MNREIKFRAFDGVDYITKPFTLLDIQNGKIQFASSDTKIMRFTGLRDKMGEDIYEGDIINHDDRLIGFIKYLGCSFIIEWIGIETYSDLLGWDNWRGGKVSDGSNYEVIGNIYQTPELLETVKSNALRKGFAMRPE